MAKPVIAQMSPIVMEMQPGKYNFCTCGKSNNQPFCNGAHTDSEFSPKSVIIEETRKVAWCGCKHSLKDEFCDGTHKNL